MFLHTLLLDCSDVFPYGHFFHCEERTRITCRSPHSAPRVRVRCGEGKTEAGLWGSAGMGSVSQALVYVAEWVQCDVGLAKLVYTRLRALWRSGGAIRRENEREACGTDGSFRGGGIVLVCEERPCLRMYVRCMFVCSTSIERNGLK